MQQQASRGRPRSELRQAVLEVLATDATMHWRAAAQAMHAQAQQLQRTSPVNPAAPSDLRLVRRTMCNMAAAGELRRVGNARVPGAARPMTLFARAQQHQPGAGLWAAMQAWGR